MGEVTKEELFGIIGQIGRFDGRKDSEQLINKLKFDSSELEIIKTNLLRIRDERSIENENKKNEK
jgi:hypothetical protein